MVIFPVICNYTITENYNLEKMKTREKVHHIRCGKSSKLGLPERLTVAEIDANHEENRNDEFDYTTNKLDQLISDPITRENTRWIARLLGNFLHEIEENGFMVHNLDLVSRLLEFVALKSGIFAEFKVLLNRMLRLCKLPLVLQKTSDSLRYNDAVELYFSTLGHLMTEALHKDHEILMVLEAISNLLVLRKNNDQLASVPYLKLEICHKAMEKSRLPIHLMELLRVSSLAVYDQALNVVLILVTTSNNCCWKMMQGGILDILFVRMSDPTGNEDSLRAACSNVPPISKQYAQSEINRKALTSNIAWYLMSSILFQQQSKSNLCAVEKLSVPAIDAMRNLRNVFRYQVIESCRGNMANRSLRNDLAVLILMGLAARPSWHLIRCGLAEDLIVLSLDCQSEVEANNENLMFRKILLTVLYHLSNRGAAIAIMAKKGVIPAILEMVNPTKIDNGTRPSGSISQFWYLSEFAMRVLGRLAKRMPEEFVRSEGPARLSLLVEWSLNVEFDDRLMIELARTICVIANTESRLILDNLAAEGLVPILFRLIRRILAFALLSMQHQRILTLVLTTIEEISVTERNCIRSCDLSSVETIVQLLRRCFQRRSKQDFQLDQRLLVAIGSYIWKRIVRCPEMSDEFVENGGIYAILDVIEEQASFNARCVFIGILTDMALNQYGAPHFSTWRGADKTKGFVSLLAKCWREEEIRSGVKRTADGCIDDVELPIMGTEQWINTIRARSPSHHFSPVLCSLLASVRPKIYCLRRIITGEVGAHLGYRQSREHYKIFTDDSSQLPLEDRMAMYIADHFYRFVQGELWAEVSRDLEQSGLNVLGMDGEIIQMMNQRHRDWGMYVRGLQKELLRAEKKRETERERKEIGKIQDSRLSTALSALDDIDYLRRTTERGYMLAVNKLQCDKVNKALKFPSILSDREHCHRTFDQRFKFTTISDQNHRVSSAYGSASSPDTKLLPILPVSPISSSSSKLFDSVTRGCSSKTNVHPRRM
ncbi:uncharacterized protein [Venturia canescens]|uniref:uncharacterized protein isoform X2 n=1 Tax=Venturia canescens TaxID=32260 RepID=UPI001C9BDB2D|nr:uncharacterized protein LOC122415179 isoform X2 [Venturia canescens]